MGTVIADHGSVAGTSVCPDVSVELPILAGFLQTEPARPHPRRRRAILAAHPEVATLIGYDRRTAAIIIAVVLGQTLLAALFGHLGLRLLVAASARRLCVGAFANHAMYVAIHDAVHNAICKTPLANKWMAIIADLPNTAADGDGVSLLSHEASFASRRL